MTNHRLYLAVAFGAVFLGIFMATTLVLMPLFRPIGPIGPVGPVGPIGPGASPDHAPAAPSPGIERLPPASRAEPLLRPPGASEPSHGPNWRGDWPFGAALQADRGTSISGYRFRPLEERELRRLEREQFSAEPPPDLWQTGQPGRAMRWDGSFEDGRRPDEGVDRGASEYRFRPLDATRSPSAPRLPLQILPPAGVAEPWSPAEGPNPYPGPVPGWRPAPWPDFYPNLQDAEGRRLA